MACASGPRVRRRPNGSRPLAGPEWAARRRPATDHERANGQTQWRARRRGQVKLGRPTSGAEEACDCLFWPRGQLIAGPHTHTRRRSGHLISPGRARPLYSRLPAPPPTTRHPARRRHYLLMRAKSHLDPLAADNDGRPPNRPAQTNTGRRTNYKRRTGQINKLCFLLLFSYSHNSS